MNTTFVEFATVFIGTYLLFRGWIWSLNKKI